LDIICTLVEIEHLNTRMVVVITKKKHYTRSVSAKLLTTTLQHYKITMKICSSVLQVMVTNVIHIKSTEKNN